MFGDNPIDVNYVVDTEENFLKALHIEMPLEHMILMIKTQNNHWIYILYMDH